VAQQRALPRTLRVALASAEDVQRRGHNFRERAEPFDVAVGRDEIVTVLIADFLKPTALTPQGISSSTTVPLFKRPRPHQPANHCGTVSRFPHRGIAPPASLHQSCQHIRAGSSGIEVPAGAVQSS
jgi:hypothetical protein